MIPGSSSALLLASAAGGAGQYQISRSLRFNNADSAYLSRTPASAGNRKTWTWAAWMKRSALATRQLFFSDLDANGDNGLIVEFDSSDCLNIGDYYSSVYSSRRTTTQVFRDPSAWQHIVIAYDTTNATANNRLRVYVNGVEITTFSNTVNPAQNYDGSIGRTNTVALGRAGAYAGFYYSGYFAECIFVDGSALTPASFGETNATTGQWVPKAYTGSYGTNGFKLDFSDNSAATAAALGKDTSGNGNNLTPNNLSVTAGSGNDSLVDTPTSSGTDTGVGGEIRGNYATLNPLSNSYPNLSNGNLDSGPWSDNGWNRNLSSIVVNTGKWYFEATIGNATDGSFRNGIGIQVNPVSTSASKYLGDSSDSYGGLAKSAGITGYTNAGAGTSLSNALSSGSVLRCAVDVDAGKVWIGDSTAYIGGGSPTSGTSPTYTFTANSNVALGVSTWGGGDVTSVNYGQRAFSATAPSGFKALCDTNLPAPVIAKPNTVMDVLLWSGTGGNRSFSSLNMSPDFVWIKQRNQAFSTGHQLYDIVRGAGSDKELNSAGTAAEGAGNIDQYGWLSSFDSNGFSVTAGPAGADYVNASGTTYVAWTWDAGSSTVTNTQGSITSQVRANASAGFSIVTYTGTGANATVGHGLGVAPSFVVVKSRSSADDWYVYHSSVGATKYLQLNTTASAATASTVWNNTTPTSTVLSIGTASSVNGNTVTFVAYCFAPVAGYSSMGSYVGNGTTNDGTFVYLGFRPKFVMVKNASSSGDWNIWDSVRDTDNVIDLRLRPSTSESESSLTNAFNNVDFLSNGFKLRGSAGLDSNSSGATYIYAAFAESPFAYSRAR